MFEISGSADLTITKLQTSETNVNNFSCVIIPDRIMRTITGMKKAVKGKMEGDLL